MVCTVNKSNFKYKGTDHWKTGQTYKGHSEWDVNFLIVRNQQGKDAYIKERELANLMAEASQHHSGKTVEKTDIKAKDPAPVTTDCELTRGLYEPKHFATTTSGTGHRWSQVPHHKLFFFFFLGGRDIHYINATITTSKKCDVHNKP